MLQGYYCDDPEAMFPNSNNDPNFNEWVKYEEAEQRIKELEEIYLGQIRVIARSRITHKEKVERMAALAEQALKV